MTAASIPSTSQSTRGRRWGGGDRTAFATRLERWSADRRHRRYLVEQRRFARRDRTDRYLDHPDETHQRQALAAFVAR